ncbi:hypothetical protein SAMN05216436_11084 [bacterium A37T11]|nr:hypothetical protein SAMN05216436_11084 [bacterium A37T11]
MTGLHKSLTVIIGFYLWTSSCYAQMAQGKDDWLLKPVTQVPVLVKNTDGQLVLKNGLISRTFTTSPGGATVGFDNLTTGESLLRSVSPEATVWINGYKLKVGGLTGQPIHNYLDPAWLKFMKADPLAMELVSWDTAAIQERFPWKPREKWIPQPTQQPKGLSVTFTYKATNEFISRYAKELNENAQREKLFTDEFLTLSPGWKLTGTGLTVKSSFINEGKAGEMMGPQEQPVYAERNIPAGSQVIIAKINAGTDRSTQTGPGITLLYGDGKTIKFNLSPGDSKFLVTSTDGQQAFPGMDPGKSYYLRIGLEPGRVIFSTSEDGTLYNQLSVKKNSQHPVKLRVGKTSSAGDDALKGVPGPMARSHIEYVTILGSPGTGANNLDFLNHVTVRIHYELYKGLPLISKWVTVENDSEKELIVNNIRTEQLAVAEAESAVEQQDRWELTPIFAQSDFSFGASTPVSASENGCISWRDDTTYTTQVNYELKTPALLVCEPKHGIGQEIAKGKPFESMRMWEMLYDSPNRERRGLEEKKMYRSIAPWVQENPIIMHVSNADDASVKKAIDQSADVGFETVIMTFGSGFNPEDTSLANIQRMKKLEQYASGKGVALGGYSLLASRSIDPANDVVMPAGMKPTFGNSPCLLSAWGDQYFHNLYNFYEKTGLDLLEHDGSYPGDVCASTTHPGHRGLEDSQWKQFVRIRDYYRWCRSKGIYLNIPDWYFLNGGTKTSMGYRETNWSLPRAYQEIIERQNIYDGTWEKTPSMGWMFVPLVQYHGGGDAATIEPLKEHLPHYEQRLANLFGAGVQACYRGPELYDSPETRLVVKKWVDFYKRHRRILDADIIHLRRPDGRDYDGILHADPQGQEKGLIMLYNPLDTAIHRKISIDLYYTGLQNQAQISEQDGPFRKVTLNGSHLDLETLIPAKGQTWIVVK